MTDEPLSERYSDGGVRLSVSTDREREKRKLPPAVHAPFTDWQGGIQFLSHLFQSHPGTYNSLTRGAKRSS